MSSLEEAHPTYRAGDLLWPIVRWSIIILSEPENFGWGDTMEDGKGIHRTKRAWIAAAAGLLMLALTVGLVSAQGPMPPMMPAGPQSEAATTHEQIHQMMDAMHGEGASERMHQAMGEDGERMMEQCVAMMNMMNMMSDDAMPGMMGR